MPDAQPKPPALVPPDQYRQAALLLTLMALSAATEGAGLILLVPLLGALGQGSAGQIGEFLAAIGIPANLGTLLTLFVALVGLRAVLVYQRGIAAVQFEAGLVDGLRQRAWSALLHCDWRALMNMKRADTASLLISRVDQAGAYVNQAILAAAALVTLAGVALAAMVISPLLTAGAVVSGLIVLAAFHRLRRRAGVLGEALGQAYAGIYGLLGEGLTALRVIKGLGSEDRATQELAGRLVGLRQAALSYQRDVGRSQIALQAGGAALLALLVWLALERWHSDVAVVLPMVALFARALPLIGALQSAGLNCAHTRPAVQDALSLIASAEAAREDAAGSVMAPALTTEIRLDAATVRFGAEPHAALDAVCVVIPARGITAITGASGAGKSTLADLIGGLLSPDSGAVLIDGVVLEGPLRRAWRSRVAYVQQDPVLLSASLRDNLRWAAPESSDAQLSAALEAASAGFALQLPQGLDTQLGDGGRTLSGGERQRLMLARALLREPALLILDEATSALDAENEAQIAEALLRLKTRMAVVVIGHRGALPLLADHTIQLERGRCADPD